MHVLLTINGTDFGGTESALAEIARHLSLRRHRVSVLSLKPPGRTGERLRQQGIAVHTLGMEEVVSPVSMVRATWQMKKWLQQHPVDVVHSFLPRANVISRVANRLAKGRRPHFSAERSTDYNRSPMVCRLNRWTCRWSHRVLAISPMIRDLLMRRDGLPGHRIDILENGIDLDHVDGVPKTEIRRELGLPDDALVLCTVGRLIPDKGYVYLAQAMAAMESSARDQQSQRQVHLVLVGEGDEEATIRHQVTRHGLTERVHLVGFRPDVLGILKDVDVFVLTSLEEGIPVVLLEAMASALPIVATRVGGIPDLVVEGETALLVPAAEDWRRRDPGTARAQTETDIAASLRQASVEHLAKCLDDLVTDPALRHRLGQAGRRRIEEVFRLERIITRLEDFYRQALGPAA